MNGQNSNNLRSRGTGVWTAVLSFFAIVFVLALGLILGAATLTGWCTRKYRFRADAEGIRINRVHSCGNGELMVTSGFMKDGEWVLARIDDHGKMLEKMVYTDKSVAINMPTQIVKVGGRYVYASNHQIVENAWGSHTAIIISDGDGSIKEYSAQGMDDFTDRVGYIHLAEVGENRAVLAYTTQAGEYERDVQLAIMKIP